LGQEYNIFFQNIPYQIHPTAIKHSKMIDANEINYRLSEDLESLRITDAIKPNQEQNN
jgi:hypothetical protein